MTAGSIGTPGNSIIKSYSLFFVDYNHKVAIQESGMKSDSGPMKPIRLQNQSLFLVTQKCVNTTYGFRRWPAATGRRYLNVTSFQNIEKNLELQN